MTYRILKIDPYLKPYEKAIEERMERYLKKKRELVGEGGALSDFANGHLYFGFHREGDEWVYREWAPGAEAIFLIGDMTDWRKFDLPLTPIGNGVFEGRFPGDLMYHGCHVKVLVQHGGALLERIPLYIRRVEQDPSTFIWCGVIEDEAPFEWRHPAPAKTAAPLIYECHIGMAQEEGKVGTFEEFRQNVLPRVERLGYNTLQIMAIAEHPYYGSFGYQVSNFFAPSSRFGPSRDLKRLIDDAHGRGIAVLLDLVHSHAVGNTAEGIAEFDGTPTQFFHAGGRGTHPAWGTRLFDYGKNEVIHFLLSNVKYWLEEFRFDGFRFDGVTSMLYRDHGLGVGFTDYSMYFSENTDHDAVTYLQLANELVREVAPQALTVAEDMSGMPGAALPVAWGGLGFDYRLAMGEPDLWVRLIREVPDEKWDMWRVWNEVSGRRPGEKNVGYAESHDQALVGDKTILFRLCDKNMYTEMTRESRDLVVERGIAVAKLIRFFTMTAGGEGYLNFMGNEFGHPEWIDFPREGNGWSYHYCRRQWHLADDPSLKYSFLLDFDRAMIAFLKESRILTAPPVRLAVDNEKKVLVYERKNYVFAVNFHPVASYEGYLLPVKKEGRYRVLLSTDRGEFGGYDRISESVRHETENGACPVYLPARCACILKKVK